MSIETIVSVIIGGLITIVVSAIFNQLSSKKLDRVARNLDDQTQFLSSENERLRSISKGIIMALQKPGESEPRYNDDGTFSGWHITQKFDIVTIPVDEQGNRLDVPKYKSLWRRFVARVKG